MSGPYDWPRLYLLNLYREAVERGYIIVEQIDKHRAESLKMALYRLRRRSDKSNATIILPEYHLVTCGEWRNNEMPVLYNAIPDGMLPAIRDARTGEALPSIAERSQQPLHLNVLPPASGPGHEPLSLDLANLGKDAAVDNFDISSFVAKMRRDAASHD